MLLELAVGDAYGAGFEYVERNLVRQFNTLERYVKHPRHNIRLGSYTDDTQMSIAIAEAMLSGVPWTPEVLAEAFVSAFKRDPHEGYAQGFYHFLKQVKDGEHFLAQIRPDSEKSGAAMRAAPIGFFPTVEEVIERATLQARLTHNTPRGIGAAVAAALMSHYFLYQRGPKKDLGIFLKRYVDEDWSDLWDGKVRSKGWMSVRAAATALMAHDRMSALLQACIDFSGDVDTVAAIALAAGACSEEIAQDLPEHLIFELEDGPYGRRYLIDLDRQLHALFPDAHILTAYL